MANLKNTTIDDTASLLLPVGTTAQRLAGLETGMIRFNSNKGLVEQYDGVAWFDNFDASALATGGDSVEDITVDGVNYRVHTFTSVGTNTFTVTRAGPVEYLIVAGGGAGGRGNPDRGGGGAGGVLSGSTIASVQSYQIVVGSGGEVLDGTGNGVNGVNSSAFGLTAFGGGGGGNFRSNGVSGGSGGGGGGGSNETPGTSDNGGTGGGGVQGQGNAGGTGGENAGASRNNGGGGGGAGSPGLNAGQGNFGSAVNQNAGGGGGFGIVSNITGTNQFFGGGGAGGSNSGTNGLGGTGGGGNAPGGNGSPNTGSGGGGGGGAGGSGIVIVRYRIG